MSICVLASLLPGSFLYRACDDGIWVLFYAVCVLRPVYIIMIASGSLVIDICFKVSWGDRWGAGTEVRFGGVVDFVFVGRGCWLRGRCAPCYVSCLWRGCSACLSF